MRWDEIADGLRASPFYRERLGAARPRELAACPLTTRDDLLRDQLAHLPLGTRRPEGAPRPVRVGVTGTGGGLLVLAWSAAELARERAAGARLLRRLGVAPGMRIANVLPGALTTPGALLLGDVVEELGGLDVPLGTEDARAAWELVDRVTPEVLVLDDAATFLAAAPPAARPGWRGIVRRGTGHAATSIPAAAGFTGWQRGWLAVPEATSFVAGTCAEGRHHADEGVIAEVVDAHGTPLPPGRDGVLALTPLGLEAPLVRFATGIAVRECARPCPCGADEASLELR